MGEINKYIFKKQIEKLKQELESLNNTQRELLNAGGDDLWVREEINMVEEQIHELQDELEEED